VETVGPVPLALFVLKALPGQSPNPMNASLGMGPAGQDFGLPGPPDGKPTVVVRLAAHDQNLER
jgi:hypothetical protein